MYSAASMVEGGCVEFSRILKFLDAVEGGCVESPSSLVRRERVGNDSIKLISSCVSLLELPDLQVAREDLVDWFVKDDIVEVLPRGTISNQCLF